MVRQGRSATSVFRKVITAVISENDIWSKITAKAIRLKFPEEYGAAKDFVTNEQEWPRTKWNDTTADGAKSQLQPSENLKVDHRIN